MAVTIGVARKDGFVSELIGWFGAGYWSHAFNVLQDDSYVLDARANEIDGIAPGVRIRPMSYLQDEERLIIEVPSTAAQAKKWLALGMAQIGKPYNSIGIVDFALGRIRDSNYDWRDQTSWFCSELDAYMLESAGIIPQLPKGIFRITPGDIAIAATAAGGKIRAHLKPGQPWPGSTSK